MITSSPAISRGGWNTWECPSRNSTPSPTLFGMREFGKGMTTATGRKRTSGTDRISLAEREIRPDELMPGQVARYEADVARLLEGRQEFVGVPCPACGQADG